ncbi:hypothetical protein C8R44DRAFT_869328 [Mycena epipterygia]|nr:hypothetical protein C8R44DRAFT_869328 [Mycena epipterygia]
MDDTSLNAHPSWILSPTPVLSTFELDALIRRTSPIIQTTVNKCFKGWTSGTRTEIGKKVLIEIIKSGHLWICVEGDQDYCLMENPTMDTEKEWELSPQDVDTVKQMLEPDDAFLQLAAQTTPAMRIGMIVWLVVTSKSLPVPIYEARKSAWDKWDIQGRAITIWADFYSEIMCSKKRPSEAILTDDDAVAVFKSAMDIAGHHHDYQAIPDLGAWATMRAAFFPKLKGSELECWHFNDVDGCLLCDERFREKLQSETGLDYMPPLHLTALWDYFRHCEDFEERIAFAVFQRPHLFLPEIVKPIEMLLAQHVPEKARWRYSLHYQLIRDDPLVDLEYPDINPNPPSWKKIADMIDSLLRFAPGCENRSFPLIEPIFWFDMVRVLGGQYQSQDMGKDTSWRPRVSLAVALELHNYVLYKKFPPLNLDLLPQHVQHAAKRFCRATEGDEHTCSVSECSWSELDMEVRTRYAAAYAQLYSTDLVPFLGDESDDSDDCDACSDIRALYDCIDAISAGQITLGSKNIAKVLDFIKQLAEDRSDVDDSEDRSDSSQRRDEQQQWGDNSEIIHDETHNATPISTENEMNHFNPTALTQPETYDPVWQVDLTAPQIYDNLTMGQDTMTEAHTSAQEHVGEITNLRWAAPREDSEPLLFRNVIQDSSLGEVAGSHVVPEANWLTEQPPDLMVTYNVAGASRPKDIENAGPKISKEAKKKELHAFFVSSFKKHGVPLGTTGMAEARLPWKKMMSILAEQGLEIAGWPEGVPKPRSDGKADKGISGFNAEHIAALYKAMKAGQIDFRPLAGGSPTNDASRVRQREDDMEEVEIRPSKKGKSAETTKKPKDFVAMTSVMKL